MTICGRCSSPWSNKYYPILANGCLPSDRFGHVFLPTEAHLTQSIVHLRRLRELEVIANNAFGSYCEMYYGSPEGSTLVPSVYLWDLDDNQFAMCALVKKSMPRNLRHPSKNGPFPRVSTLPVAKADTKTDGCASQLVKALKSCMSRFGSGQCHKAVLGVGLDPCGGGNRGRRGKESKG